MIKNLDEVFNLLDNINDINNTNYLDCKYHSYDNEEWYKRILEKVLENKPKRVIDIGSNLNQYGYLFANENIEYIGIDNATCLPNKYGIMQPLITDKIKFIQAPYERVSDYFKDDVVISCLCVGYLIPIEKVKFKRLIINDLDKNGKATAKEICLQENR
mgnify:CR=1 FL=1